MMTAEVGNDSRATPAAAATTTMAAMAATDTKAAVAATTTKFVADKSFPSHLLSLGMGDVPMTTTETTTTTTTRDSPDAPVSVTTNATDATADFDHPPATVLQDLIAGGVAGSASVVVGHPFDTYKVRLQTSSASSSSSSSGISSTASSKSFGGVASLFRGMTAPLGTAAVVNAIIFSSFGESSRWWDEHFAVGSGNGDGNGNIAQKIDFVKEYDGDDVAGLDGSTTANTDDNGSVNTNLTKSLLCGSFAGFTQCLVICPMEHIKCRLQVQHGVGSADHLYRGPLDAIDKIVEGHGVRGLYRGWWCTALREVPAFGLYFATYDDIKDRINRALDDGVDHASEDEEHGHHTFVPKHTHAWAASAIAGGLAGSLTWAVIYPVDVIKSRIQTSPLHTPVDMWGVARDIVQQNGWKFMFRGLGVTLARAFPVNGIIFPVYEFTLMKLAKSGIRGGGGGGLM